MTHETEALSIINTKRKKSVMHNFYTTRELHRLHAEAEVSAIECSPRERPLEGGST